MKRLGILLGLMVLVSGPAWGAHPDSRSEIENLKSRIEALETEIGLEPPDETPFALQAAGRRLTLGGLLELEATYRKTRGEKAVSDLLLATAELSAEVAVNDWIGGHLLLLYEEEPGGGDALQVDEAVISLRCPRPLFGQTVAFHGGRIYLPFGTYNSFMISDPLTVDLGETRNSVALLAFEGERWTLAAGGFNGEVDTGRDTIDTAVAALTLTPLEGVTFGGSWISDLAESGAGLVDDPALYDRRVEGGSAFLSLVYGPVALEAEVVAALDDFAPALVGLADLTGERPRAANVEIAWSPLERLQLAARYEEASDWLDDATRAGATISWGLLPYTVVAGEYLVSDYATAPDDQTATAQLAFEF